MMKNPAKQRLKTIMNREMLNTLTEGCPACGGKFTLGEPVVQARGAWGAAPKYIHENEAVFDEATSFYYEKKYYEAKIKNQHPVSFHRHTLNRAERVIPLLPGTV
jgi:hypothetical protein